MSEIEVWGECPIPTAQLQTMVQLVCSAEDPTRNYNIGLLLVDDAEMQHYNRTYRGVNEATDILSFITATVPGQSQRNMREENPPASLSLQKSPAQICEQVFCDIIIDIKQLIRQKGNLSLADEFCSVLVHGLLHLIGYDHIRKIDATIMQNKEAIYLKQIKGL